MKEKANFRMIYSYGTDYIKNIQLSPRAATDEVRAPGACALQQEKPLQWEAWPPQPRVAPTHCY